MSTLVKKRLINTDEYYKIGEIGMFHPDERTELINGEICTMAPIGSKHAAIVRQLSMILSRTLEDATIISSQQPVYIDHWNELQPDIAVLKNRNDNYYEAHPNPEDVLIIFEVSDTSYNIDKNIKLPIYASAGIPVFWIVNINENSIAVYEEPFNDRYRRTTLYFPDDQISIFSKSVGVSEILIV